MSASKTHSMFYQYDKDFAPKARVDSAVGQRRGRDLGAHLGRAVEADVAPPSYDLFVDLDSYTEYSDVYRPELAGKFMNDVNLLFPRTVPLWFDLARAAGTPQENAASDALNAELAKPQVGAAIVELDTLLKDLVVKHFALTDGSSVDASKYLPVVEAFAREIFPLDQDRLNRLAPDDERRAEAPHHRMNGTSMWFAWAAVVDCASLLPDAGGMTDWRAVQLAACAFGSAMDFVFRHRGKTRPTYHPDPQTETSLRHDAAAWASNGDEARRQARELYKIFASSDDSPG